MSLVKEKFKSTEVQLSPKQKNNVESNWLLIIGGLREFLNQKQIKGNQLNKYGIIHMLRQIDGYYHYPITDALFQLVNEKLPDEIYRLKKKGNYLMNSNLRTVFNRLLKQKDIKESIQIEHFNGGVRNLVDILIEEISTQKLVNIENLKTLHQSHTLCCYKLKSESDLNERTKLDSIKLFKGFNL